MTTRRRFLNGCLATPLAAPLSESLGAAETEQLFAISLAQWSLHKTIFGGKLTNLDFPAAAKNDYGIDAVEFVNQFWKDKATNQDYLKELKKRCEDLGVRSVLIMCDGEGALGDPDAAKRKQAVDNHRKWIAAAKFLGCHSIRVNAQTGDQGSREEQASHAAEGLRALSEAAAPDKINVIVENHGGLSSDGAWLAAVMKSVGLPNCGTLPDFGNFKVKPSLEYDRYKGVDELMPFAKGVSAKSHEFNEKGEETQTDYRKMLDIVVKKHGYRGFIGVEYEGNRLSEPEGIKATKALLEKVRGELAVA
ncbi:MAG: sugar phosphate isomerase/epimerase family protein [Verrucomicrobiales bacterium]